MHEVIESIHQQVDSRDPNLIKQSSLQNMPSLTAGKVIYRELAFLKWRSEATIDRAALRLKHKNQLSSKQSCFVVERGNHQPKYHILCTVGDLLPAHLCLADICA